MHELGIVFSIIKQVDEVAKANDAACVKEVTLEIGEVSGIVPKYLFDCWKWAVDNRSERMKGCELRVIPIKARTFCEHCGRSYDTVKNGRICPFCKSSDTYLLTGNETVIKDIKVLDEKPA